LPVDQRVQLVDHNRGRVEAVRNEPVRRHRPQQAAVRAVADLVAANLEQIEQRTRLDEAARGLLADV